MRNLGILQGILRGAMALVFFLLSSHFIFAEPPAKEIKIIFTGQSYASLYPCSCPIEPDGGIARRAAFIKKMRASSQNLFLLEAGSSLASGREDQYSQNYESDSLRTEIYLKALKIMGYDALLAGSQEYAFGVDFLKRHQDLPFVTSNVTAGPARSYVIKELSGIKVGVLGLTDESVVAKGVPGWQAPAQILQARVKELKNKGVRIIILLSSLKLQEDEALLKNVKGINVVINSNPSYGSVSLKEQNGVAYLTTWWQGRRAGILTLKVGRQGDIKESLGFARLSAELPDDEAISDILPKCFSERDCKGMAGFISKCEEASTLAARCTYTEQPKIGLTIIEPRICHTCRVQAVLKDLKRTFGDFKMVTLYEDEAQARDLIKKFNVSMLPVYLFHKDIEKSGFFSGLSPFLEKGENFYMLKPQVAGVSYFVKRPRLPKRLDIFFDYSYPGLTDLFRVIKAFSEKHRDIDIEINFLARRNKEGDFISKGGLSEVEEFKRVACISESYPKELLDYLICRAQQKDSSWWDVCAQQSKIDAAKVRGCALSAKAMTMMAKRTQLTAELQIVPGPTFMVDNKEIFGMVNVPSLEEFEKAVFGGQTETSVVQSGSKK